MSKVLTLAGAGSGKTHTVEQSVATKLLRVSSNMK